MPLNPNAIELKNYDLGGSFLSGLEKGQAQARSNALAAKIANRGKTPISDIYAQEGMGEESLKAAELEAQTAKNQASTTGLGLKNKEDMLNIGMKASQEMLASPNLSKETVKQTFDKYFNMGLTDRNIYQQQLQSLGTLPDDPEALRQHIMGNVQAAMSAKDAMAQTAPDANALLSDQRAAAGQALTARGQDIGQQQFGQTYGLNERKFNEDVSLNERKFNENVNQNEFERANKEAQYNLSDRELNLKENAKNADKTAINQGAIDSIDTAMESLNSIINHPGLQSVVGAPNPLVGSFGSMGALPGTDAAGFNARLETFKAQTFVPMVAQLKGMGALSDAEGKKLSAAVGALDTKMPENEFKASAKNILQELRLKKERVLGYNGPRQHGASDSWGGKTPPPKPDNASDDEWAAFLKSKGMM